MVIKTLQKSTPADQGYIAAEFFKDIGKFRRHYPASDDCQYIGKLLHVPQGMWRINAMKVDAFIIGNIRA